MPPDLREWLPAGHLAWFVIEAIEAMESTGSMAYRHDGRCRPAFDPAMMVGLLLYAYARGVRSSRTIERACEEDVAFRVIAAQRHPDHATIARFIERHQDTIAGLFGEVLALYARSGLARVGVIAVDGSKLQANASRDENLDHEQIAREIRRPKAVGDPAGGRDSEVARCERECRTGVRSEADVSRTGARVERRSGTRSYLDPTQAHKRT
jgi:transposase